MSVAVIGMAGRFPGAPDVPALWDLLAHGREGLTRLGPADLAAARLSPEVAADPRYVPAAGVLDGIDQFDAGFWGIGRHEAELMDPQQRILLEVAWHALEDAGLDPRRNEAAIGVFVGSAISTYLLFQLHGRIAGPSAPSQLLAMMGNDKDYSATQLAYRLNLTGPAVAVQTACSSSLVAVHLACQSLLSGECDIAIAGGVSVRVPHRVGYLHEAGGMLSPDGHCRSFAEDAAGTVFGSGCGLVVLRRQEDAGRDRVRALVLGSAINNDGSAKVGFTAPSQQRQSAVVAEAMAVAGVRPEAMGYVEGHGTGTPLGDPIEVAALAAAYRGARPDGCFLGSAKSNLGHTETAAGVTGLIKTVLMLERETIAPTLHADAPSSKIAWADTPFALPREARRWHERQAAGVSSFGIGGTNAHVVVARAPARCAPARLATPRLLISAQDRDALAELTAAYRHRLVTQDFALVAAAAARRARLAWWVEVDAADALADAVPQSGPAPSASVAAGYPVDLPPYPFQRQRYWATEAHSDDRLLGAPVRTPFDATLWPVAIDLGRQGWLRDHLVQGEVLLPAAFHLALFAEAAPGTAFEAVEIVAPLTLTDAHTLQLWQAADGGIRAVAEQAPGWQCLAEARRAAPAPANAAWEAGNSTSTNDAMTGAAWTAAMASAGLAFGPAFRLIAEILRHGNEVRAELDISAPANAVTLLDAGLQALGAAVRGGGEGFRPASIARFAVTGDIGGARTLLARLTADAAEAKTGDVLWLDAAGRTVAEARGIVCRPACRGSDMLYRLVWRAEGEGDGAGPHEALERIARRFASDALQAVPSPARATLAERLRRHAALADAGAPDPVEACRVLADQHRDHAQEIALVGRCGAALPGVLAGTDDPLALLFGSEDGADGAYRASPLAQRLNRVAGHIAASARPRRILEIGGGTAATTEALRAAWPNAAEYLFTDISPGFLAGAARRFAGWPALRTAALDISRDPAGQGFEAGAWDLVVAANVLHAAPDLAAALRHACRLLAPGGRLLLIEGTEALARLDITFGLTDGWTTQHDTGLRPDHPLVPTATWCDLLREAGLCQPVVLAEAGGQAVLTAAAGPSGWIAMGRDAVLADRLGLGFVPLDAKLPDTALAGVVALAGLEPIMHPVRDLLAVSRAVLDRADAPRLLIPTHGAEAISPADRPQPDRAALGGFARTLAREHPALRPRTVDFETTDLSGNAMAATANALAAECVLEDGEDRVAWRHGARLLARMDRLAQQAPAADAVRLSSDLQIEPMAVPRPGPGQVVVRVRAAGINYKDVLTATGQLPGTATLLGGECAGVVEAVGGGVTALTPGDPVLAVAAGSLASHVVADARLVLPKPATLGFAAAAALPIAGVTAWHALRHLARLARGQRILVHAATGGVGWFALRVAQAIGAEVVATAGSPAKRQMLARLEVQAIYSSRDAGFAAAGPVDVVLGAAPADLRDAGLLMVRSGGHYIEIGRTGLLTPAEAAARRPDIAYHIVALDQVDAPMFGSLLREVLDAVAADPTLLPPVATVPLIEARGAFETIMRSEHVGKLVALPSLPARIRGDATYVVTGGLGGLGPDIADWLARRGAGGVIAVARRAPPGEVPGHVVVGDVADAATLRTADARALALGLPPVRGVVHAAGLLEDGLVATLDPSSLQRIAAPKLDGLAAILAHWPDLDSLVGFSSAGALFGSAGQAAHTAASAALDAAPAVRPSRRGSSGGDRLGRLARPRRGGVTRLGGRARHVRHGQHRDGGRVRGARSGACGRRGPRRGAADRLGRHARGRHACGAARPRRR